jgi:hypothetical protein
MPMIRAVMVTVVRLSVIMPSVVAPIIWPNYFPCLRLLSFLTKIIKELNRIFSGILTQVIVTGSKVFHEEPFPSRKHRQNPETREERKQRKYRYLYQVGPKHSNNFKTSSCHFL